MFKYTHLAPHNFLGLEEQTKKPKFKVAILPVPYEATTTYQKGARQGPWAIIEASRQVEFYDMELKREIIKDVLIDTLPELEPSSNGPKEVVAQIEKAVKQIIDNDFFPLMLGGEHSITLGSISVLTKKYKKFSVLQIDAHTDLRDSYEGSRYNHACVMRRIWELGCRVTSVGIRSTTEEDQKFLSKKKAAVFYDNEFKIDEVVRSLGDNVYITIDLDGFDPAFVPAVGTPEPGGLSWKQVTGLIRAVAKNRKVIGADVVELAPIPGQVTSDFLAAKLVYKVIGYISEGTFK